MDALTKVILAMAIALILLVGIVIIVGLLQRTLDPTGTAMVLMGAFTGLMTGFYAKHKADTPND